MGMIISMYVSFIFLCSDKREVFIELKRRQESIRNGLHLVSAKSREKAE